MQHDNMEYNQNFIQHTVFEHSFAKVRINLIQCPAVVLGRKELRTSGEYVCATAGAMGAMGGNRSEAAAGYDWMFSDFSVMGP